MIEDKHTLRGAMRQRIRDLSDEECRTSDDAITRRLLTWTAQRNIQRVFCYYSMGREVSTEAFVIAAAAHGMTVALPVSREHGAMEFYRYTGTLRRGLYGIMEPEPEERLVPEPDDLIVVPGLCFDRAGYRLGRGGGYYDRYLAGHDGITLGLCREVLLQEELPRTWNDLPVEYVLTETAMFSVKNGASEEAPREYA